MKKKLTRNTIILVLMMLFTIVSVSSFAYWDILEKSNSETIQVGEGTTIVVSAVAEVPEGKFLVPAGTVLKANDVEEVVLTYNVKLDKEALTALGLQVNASNVLVGGSSEYQNLVSIQIDLAQPTVNATDVLVTVTVVLNEPANLTEYLAIVNQPITFDLTFTASQN